ncbi:L-ascorbate metabolism protein UlaG, beta-lactamase superfamily [Chitinophaga filiformis]|uniref:L-ascorbate metabolism protein UlaG, beta-lactamase superfamily n=2 Tax=Chitinophaga filiformis TaxID=104663 RepID=A0A1G8CJH2_CHIFI|nr:L-ascorbate metabolism protein UlaG, beta-lactamase superfamily [Chitinophaga filiformis]
MMAAMEYVFNPDLPGMQLPFDWKGTPVDENGKFMNHEFPHQYSFSEFLKWRLQRNPQKAEKKADRWIPDIVYNEDFLHSGKDCIVWFGHASFFIRLAGVNILIDPVFYDIPLFKRRTPFPIDPAKLKGLDYILMSHNHLDHCDKRSLNLLAANNPQAVYLTGLKMESLLEKLTGSEQIQEAGWYQQYHTEARIKVFFLPARHWSKRGLRDLNSQLWGAFVIQGDGKTIYFAADSGYGSHFEDVGRIFPHIDYCIVGIGAYKPAFFMSQSHISPQDAVKAANDMHAKVMIPMHYGTFDLSDEPLSDPFNTLKELEKQGAIQGRLDLLKVGEELRIH